MTVAPLVVDSSVLIALILPADGDDDHGGLDEALVDDRLDVLAPPLIDIELINVAARRRQLDEPSLQRIVNRLEELAITRIDPELRDIAHWASRGLSAYDATYAALAESTDAALLTQDRDFHFLLPQRATRRV